MKNLLLIAQCRLFITTSWRKDDDANRLALIVGTWKLNKQVTQYGNGSFEAAKLNLYAAQ